MSICFNELTLESGLFLLIGTKQQAECFAMDYQTDLKYKLSTYLYCGAYYLESDLLKKYTKVILVTHL